MLRNVSDPSFTVFTPDPAKANGAGIIVCPGGVWRVLAWEHEGITPVRWLAARGYTAFLLKYRVRGTPPDPAEYAENVAKRFAGIPAVIPGAKAPRALADGLPDESIPAPGKSPATTAVPRSRSSASEPPNGASSRIGLAWSAFPPAPFWPPTSRWNRAAHRWPSSRRSMAARPGPPRVVVENCPDCCSLCLRKTTKATTTKKT
ncbi:hypothetical protein [Edaphobacter modestus]|uniref:hypothetical protein n=1 Tax=Edaphobacter modestus TaxID=388466 RepID=UPI001F5FC198|nr:hypothetical protein [Edaphobacter modestus]